MPKDMKCDGCGSEIELEFDPLDPTQVGNEMIDFIIEQEHWKEYYPPSICWGMLEAVMTVVFEIAPNDEKAIQVITDVTRRFIDADA